jgi:hypothetical protein
MVAVVQYLIVNNLHAFQSAVPAMRHYAAVQRSVAVQAQPLSKSTLNAMIIRCAQVLHYA